MKKITYSTLILLLLTFVVRAQDEVVNSPNGGSEKMMVPGYAVTMYQYSNTPGTTPTHNFSPVGIAAFPIVKYNDRLFLDCALTLGANSDGSATAGIGELVGFKKINDYMTAFLGNFSPHYGIYLGILDDFTDRFGTGVGPVGMGHGLANQNGVGIQGGFQAGYSKFTYQVYAANGPQLIADTSAADIGSTGVLKYDPYTDNNRNKSVGWHVGFLPFSNSCLELTFSGEYVPKTGASGDPNFENINATSMAFGLNYYHVFNPIMVRVLGEYNSVRVTNYHYSWQVTDSTSIVLPDFNNKQNGWFAGMTLRATGSQSHFLSNLEFAGRLGAYNPPKDALWGGAQTTQTTFTITYYLTWAIPLSFEYDALTQNGVTQKIFSTVLFFRF